MLPGWHTRSLKVAMLLPLHADPDRVFAAFTAKLRSQVRRAAKAGAVARVSTGADVPEREIDGFYHVFATNMRDLGTPVYPRRLFTSALRAFSAHARLITVWLGERCTAGAVTIGGGQVTEIPWASSLRRDNHTAANMLLYWEAIRHACLDGYCTFDFGRSTPNSGTFRFKQQWGAVPKPLYWHYFLKPDGLVPELSPNDPKYHLLTAIWQRLPLSVSRAAGPWLTRSLP
jgi:FemAB-related protein (PEP-CTERM system-associated)